MSPRRSGLHSLLTVVLLAAGCHRPDDVGESEAVPLAHAGVEVWFLVPSEMDLTEAWTPALNDWADETGATYDIVEFDFSAADERHLAEQLTAVEATLVLLPSPLINSLVAEDLVSPIPRTILDEDVIAWSVIPPSVRQLLGSLGDEPSMVPVTCPMPVCCYRADLLEAAGKPIPTTWEDYDALAVTLPEWAPGHIAVEPWAEPFRTTMFFARAISAAKHPAQYSVELDVASGEPLIATPPFVKALEELVSLKPHLADNAKSLSPHGCLLELREGRAAMGVVWETSAAAASPTEDQSATADATSRQSASPGQLTFAPLPGRSEVYDRDSGKWTAPPVEDRNRPALSGSGGLSVCVLSSATDREQSAAWDLWGLLESYQSDGTIPRLPGSSVKPSDLGSSPGWDGLFAGQRQQYRQSVMRSLQNPLLVCEFPVLGQQRLRSDLSRAIGRALQGDGAPDVVLGEVSHQWSATIDEIGRTKVLNSYRRRLGLTQLPE